MEQTKQVVVFSRNLQDLKVGTSLHVLRFPDLPWFSIPCFNGGQRVSSEATSISTGRTDGVGVETPFVEPEPLRFPFLDMDQVVKDGKVLEYV